ncbi:MAG: hypothetical protein WEB03_11620 [Nitriliruptor sp.]
MKRWLDRALFCVFLASLAYFALPSAMLGGGASFIIVDGPLDGTDLPQW